MTKISIEWHHCNFCYKIFRRIPNIRIIRKAQNIQNFQKTKKMQIILIIPNLKIPQPHNPITS